MEEILKQCRTCDKEKALDNFGNEKNGKYGKKGTCKQCMAEKYANRDEEYHTNRKNVGREYMQKRRREYTPEQKKLELIERRAREEQKPWLYKSKSLLYRYNITIIQYWMMLDQQEGKCKGCKIKPGINDKPLFIDHDHKCCPSNIKTCGNCIRALLCDDCNKTLGTAKDNPNILRALADLL